MQEKEKIDQFTSLIEVGLRGKYSLEDFATLLSRKLSLPERDQRLLGRVYNQIKQLEEQGENGIWARYIKNAFAPVYLGRFDFVVGNPPGYGGDTCRTITAKELSTSGSDMAFSL